MSNMDYRREKVKSGSSIVSEDTWSYYAYVILSGKAKVVKDAEGVQEVVGTLRQGDVFGEMSIIGGTKRTASVIADGDVEVAMIAKDTILDLMKTFSEATRSKLNHLASDLTHVNHICANLAHQIHEIENLKVKRVDVNSFSNQLTAEMKNVPDIYKDVFITLANRLNLGIETLAKLSKQAEGVSRVAESVSVSTAGQSK